MVEVQVGERSLSVDDLPKEVSLCLPQHHAETVHISRLVCIFYDMSFGCELLGTGVCTLVCVLGQEADILLEVAESQVSDSHLRARLIHEQVRRMEVSVMVASPNLTQELHLFCYVTHQVQLCLDRHVVRRFEDQLAQRLEFGMTLTHQKLAPLVAQNHERSLNKFGLTVHQHFFDFFVKLSEDKRTEICDLYLSQFDLDMKLGCLPGILGIETSRSCQVLPFWRNWVREID